jgi:hypothetical protein
MAEAISSPYKAAKRYHYDYPEMGTGPVSVEPYVSQEYFELERERIFKKVWLYACRIEQLSTAASTVGHTPWLAN